MASILLWWIVSLFDDILTVSLKWIVSLLCIYVRKQGLFMLLDFGCPDRLVMQLSLCWS